MHGKMCANELQLVLVLQVSDWMKKWSEFLSQSCREVM